MSTLSSIVDICASYQSYTIYMCIIYHIYRSTTATRYDGKIKRNFAAVVSNVPPDCFCSCASNGDSFRCMLAFSLLVASSALTERSKLVDLWDDSLKIGGFVAANMALSMETQLQSIFEDVVVIYIFIYLF